MTTSTFCDRVRQRDVVYGGWLSVPSAVSARALASAGLDYVCIDLQHGGATERDLPELTSAIRLAGAAPLGRVRHAHPADIGRALDLGCEGVIVPNVDSARQAEVVAGACRYPPDGYRSAGGVLAGPDRPLCIVMAESQQALAELAETLAVPGVDGIYVGPRDLSLSLGCALDPSDPVLRPALERVWSQCAAAGKPAGVHATDGPTGRLYRDNGCSLVTVVNDNVTIRRGAAAELAAATS
ncbi:MAG TPA: aldolase/citrate lyase family protein [Streptosporangiaceae bacterium]